MPADMSAAGAFVLSWSATYLIHSTCLSAGVWLYLRARAGAGHALRESLWKTALVGSIVTASGQMFLGLGGTLTEVTLSVDEFPLRAAAPGTNLPARGTSNRGINHDEPTTNQSADRAMASSVAAAAPETGDLVWIATGDSAAETAAGRGPDAAAL